MALGKQRRYDFMHKDQVAVFWEQILESLYVYLFIPSLQVGNISLRRLIIVATWHTLCPMTKF